MQLRQCRFKYLYTYVNRLAVELRCRSPCYLANDMRNKDNNTRWTCRLHLIGVANNPRDEVILSTSLSSHSSGRNGPDPAMCGVSRHVSRGVFSFSLSLHQRSGQSGHFSAQESHRCLPTEQVPHGNTPCQSRHLSWGNNLCRSARRRSLPCLW